MFKKFKRYLSASPNSVMTKEIPYSDTVCEERDSMLSQFIDSRRYWYHGYRLTPQVYLPGGVNVHERCRLLGVPEDLTGCNVLDVGAQSGGFSLEFERRGANVTAIDTADPDLFGFESLRRMLGSRIRYIKMDVYDIDHSFEENYFDYILFSGVFYHLRHPLLVLDKLRKVVKRSMWVESYVIDNGFVHNNKRIRLPEKYKNSSIMQFYRLNELSNDVTNWFAPTSVCLNDILMSCGFSSKFCGYDETGYRGFFTANKISGVPEHLNIIENSNYDIKYSNKHYKC